MIRRILCILLYLILMYFVQICKIKILILYFIYFNIINKISGLYNRPCCCALLEGYRNAENNLADSILADSFLADRYLDRIIFCPKIFYQKLFQPNNILNDST